jgi:hypothetical protein
MSYPKAMMDADKKNKHRSRYQGGKDHGGKR